MSKESLTQLASFLQDEGWACDVAPEIGGIRAPFTGKSGRWLCFIKVDEQNHLVSCFSLCPINVPGEAFAKIVEFLGRANFGMPYGCFELDWDDGEIRFKTTLDTDDAPLTQPRLSRLIYGNVAALDVYLPGLMAIIEQNKEVNEALELVRQLAGDDSSA